MSRLVSIFITLLFTAFSVPGQSQTNWFKYESPEGRYSISIPKEPKISRQETTASTGESEDDSALVEKCDKFADSFRVTSK